MFPAILGLSGGHQQMPANKSSMEKKGKRQHGFLENKRDPFCVRDLYYLRARTSQMESLAYSNVLIMNVFNGELIPAAGRPGPDLLRTSFEYTDCAEESDIIRVSNS